MLGLGPSVELGKPCGVPVGVARSVDAGDDLVRELEALILGESEHLLQDLAASVAHGDQSTAGVELQLVLLQRLSAIEENRVSRLVGEEGHELVARELAGGKGPHHEDAQITLARTAQKVRPTSSCRHQSGACDGSTRPSGPR